MYLDNALTGFSYKLHEHRGGCWRNKKGPANDLGRRVPSVEKYGCK